jgi:hypothetical protein
MQKILQLKTLSTELRKCFEKNERKYDRYKHLLNDEIEYFIECLCDLFIIIIFTVSWNIHSKHFTSENHTLAKFYFSCINNTDL